MWATLKGEGAKVRTLLEAGAHVNARGRKVGWTVLMHAVNKDGAHALLWAGADVNAIDKRGNTALMSAAQDNNLEVAQALLAADTKVDIRDDAGHTALALATNQGHTEMVQLLKAAGATE